ncbi:hypothetical protein ACFY1B_44920 [Streptomyces mirabilis]|uniref:hypothetical protein n=1 Tax=Streptomyces mirabilis TaxID=68239 RepID=UPI0036C26DC1
MRMGAGQGFQGPMRFQAAALLEGGGHVEALAAWLVGTPSVGGCRLGRARGRG